MLTGWARSALLSFRSGRALSATTGMAQARQSSRSSEQSG